VTGARPGDPVSPESREWLRKVRADVKAQLFGAPTEPEPAPAPGTDAAASEPHPEDAFEFGDGPEPETPSRIGRFVVIKRIGEGGMGLVYAAYDDALDRKVAVKLLHPRGAAGSDAKTRLVREAQALARLSHPSVIHVYEVGTWQEQVYVAMEFVDGGTLGHWQRQEGRGWRDVLEAYVAAGRGLAAAHAGGIVHRDFKAANVLVRRDGAVRVVDFGLARQELESGTAVPDRPAELDNSTPSLSLVTGDMASGGDAPLTRTGVIMGTPAYMAPEQHLGHRADPRSDQFSYCVSLYEALYGFRPFAGETLGLLRRNVLAGRLEHPPRYNDIPPRIFKVLQRGLQVHPHERYPAMEPLLDDLVHDPRVALRRLAYALLVVLAAALVGALWWSEREERAARAEGEQLRAQFERARVLNAEEELRRAQSRTFTEKWDDLVLAYARDAIDEDPTVALAALKHVTPGNTDWLPAARTIASDAVQRGVKHRHLAPELGRLEGLDFVGSDRLLVTGERGAMLWWPSTKQRLRLRLPEPEAALQAVAATPEGERIVGIGFDETIYLWEIPPGDPDTVTPTLRRIDSKDGSLGTVAIAPDGEQFAVGSQSGVVRLMDWDGRSLRAIRDHEGAIRSLDYAPDGQSLVSAGSDRTLRVWFLDRQTHVTLEHGPGIRSVRFDAQGEYLWSTAEDGAVRRWTTAKGSPRAASELHDVTLFARTASGDQTFACHHARELKLYGESDPQPLRGLTSLVTAIALSADGTWAAAATTDEQVQVWRLRGSEDTDTQPDGSRIVSAHDAVTALAFSRAGSLLASATRQGRVELWSERGESRGVLGRHARVILDLGFSPQGHELAAYDEDGQITVWSVADRDQPPVYLRNTGATHTIAWSWSPDGDRISAPRCEGNECDVVLYSLAGDEPVSLGRTDSPATALRFSPTGQHLLSDHPTGSWLWDVEEGTGRGLEWPEGKQPNKRLAFAYVRGGVRMATADVLRDHEARVVSTTLRVWHIGQSSGDVHLLFEEPELRTLLVDTDGRTLMLRTHDDNTLLWRLAGDHFRLLPALGGGFDRLIVSPDARALLLRPVTEPAREVDSLWVDVESGQMRRFSRRNEPMAWSVRGTVADAVGRDGLRIWKDPTPDEVGAFLRWLDDATDTEVDPTSFR